MIKQINSSPQNHILKVAAYIRVSTENSNQEDSYELQKTYFSNYLTSSPFWVSAGIYTDYGISGTSRERRTGFERLLRHCEEGRIDHIVTKSISRFARNTRDFIKALDTLKSNHVTILFEKEQINTAAIQSDLILTAFSALAQEESRSISVNIQWGIRKHYPKGEARNIPIYGYRYAEGNDAYQTTANGYSFRKIEIVEEEAIIVRRIFTEAANQIPFTAIARHLNYDQIPAPVTPFTQKYRHMAKTPDGILNPGLSEGWTARHISQIIRLERYTGDLLLQKTYKPDYNSPKTIRNKGERNQYYVQDHHPAIVSRQLYQEVQKIRRLNSSRCAAPGARTIYPFSKLLVCNHCGRYYRTRNRSKRPLWYCASTILNNGKNVCTAEKLYEEQLIAACRQAAINRFQIMIPSPQSYTCDCRPLSSGSTPPARTLSFSVSIPSFLNTMIQKLENIQTIDTIEHDRAFLISQITKKEAELTALKTISGNPKDYSEAIQTLAELTGQLHYLEHYWEALESAYPWRKKAIDWMKSLPQNHQGLEAFLYGLAAEYTKAFILSIEICSPQSCRIHWFDDTWSNTEIPSMEN